MNNSLVVFGEELIDPKCIKQIENCLIENSIGVLTPDAHYGYGHPVGGAVAYPEHISVSGVGFDIACGNKAVKTNVRAIDVDIKRVMDEIFARISFGMGRPNSEPIDHPVFDKIDKAEVVEQRDMILLAKQQLGTVGGGNHYVDLFRDNEGWLWIGNHFGSRGFGHKTAMGFIALSQGLGFFDRPKQGGMDSPPILLNMKTEIGQAYFEAMNLAGEYAYAGRDTVVNKVLEILGARSVYEVHNHHNFAWREAHFGSFFYVVRKGCTPAFPGQRGFVGSNMSDASVIIEGVDHIDAKVALYSTVHGAGRVMSRTEAAGKRRWKKGEMVLVSPGRVDFDQVKGVMSNRNIELRGAGADEAPECYKKLSDVLNVQHNSVKVVTTLWPVGVAMAGADVVDPYKD